MFATLYFFTLLGLLMGIIGDVMYHIIDPAHRFRREGRVMPDTTAIEQTATPPPMPGRRFLGIRITPLTERRLANFRRNRRGYWSLWIFVVLFVLSLGAELIANDKPLAGAIIRQRWSTLPVQSLTTAETELRRRMLATAADYQRPLVACSGPRSTTRAGCDLGAVIRFSSDSGDQFCYLQVPGPFPAFGAELAGHRRPTGGDVMARLLYGFTRISRAIWPAADAVFQRRDRHGPSGAVQGYFGGRVDLIGTTAD